MVCCAMVERSKTTSPGTYRVKMLGIYKRKKRGKLKPKRKLTTDWLIKVLKDDDAFSSIVLCYVIKFTNTFLQFSAFPVLDGRIPGSNSLGHQQMKEILRKLFGKTHIPSPSYSMNSLWHLQQYIIYS